MQKNEILYSKQSLKFLSKLQKPLRERIVAAINDLPEGDVVRLQGIKPTTYRLRVESYRIIFLREENIIKVEKIGARGDVYK